MGEDIDTANAGVRAAEQSVAQKARVTQELRGKVAWQMASAAGGRSQQEVQDLKIGEQIV